MYTPRALRLARPALIQRVRPANISDRRLVPSPRTFAQSEALNCLGTRARTERRLTRPRTFEARYIADALAHNGGNVSRTAGVLGISRISLQRKIKEYGLR